MDEWTAEDEFDPCYCTMCRAHIPRTLSQRQGVCNACAAKRQALVKAEPQAPARAPGKLAKAGTNLPAQRSQFDTHLGVCKSCGSPNLALDAWDNPVGDAVNRGFERTFQHLMGVIDLRPEAMQGPPMRQEAVPDWSRLHIEPDTVVRCRDCGKRWKWKDRKG